MITVEHSIGITAKKTAELLNDHLMVLSWIRKDKDLDVSQLHKLRVEINKIPDRIRELAADKTPAPPEID